MNELVVQYAGLTFLAEACFCDSLHLGVDHAFFKLSVRIKHLSKITHRRDCLNRLLINVSCLGREDSERKEDS